MIHRCLPFSNFYGRKAFYECFGGEIRALFPSRKKKIDLYEHKSSLCCFKFFVFVVAIQFVLYF